jgi:hypothetical protein
MFVVAQQILFVAFSIFIYGTFLVAFSTPSVQKTDFITYLASFYVELGPRP